MRKLVKFQRGLGIVVLIGLMTPLLYAGPGGGGGRGGGGRGQRGQQDQRGQRDQESGFDRAASMQERMLEMMKERLGASDEEWTIIKPRLSEVMTLSQNARGTTMRGNRGGNRGGQTTSATEAPTDPLQIATVELQTTLAKEAPTAAEIKARLTALRGAREKNKQKLVTAQLKLKEVLTVKQEAILVMMSMLE